jgi:hypothetical protein
MIPGKNLLKQSEQENKLQGKSGKQNQTTYLAAIAH